MAEAGRNAYFSLDNASDVLTNISTKIENINAPRQIGNATVTTLGDTAEEYIITVSDASFSMSGPWDDTIDAHISGVLTTNNLDYEFGPEGNTAGDIKYSGDCIVASYDIQANYQGAVQFSLQLQCSGTIARGTF